MPSTFRLIRMLVITRAIEAVRSFGISTPRIELIGFQSLAFQRYALACDHFPLRRKALAPGLQKGDGKYTPSRDIESRSPSIGWRFVFIAQRGFDALKSAQALNHTDGTPGTLYDRSEWPSTRSPDWMFCSITATIFCRHSHLYSFGPTNT